MKFITSGGTTSGGTAERYAVGEVVDMVSTADYLENASGKWIKMGASVTVPASRVAAAGRKYLANSGNPETCMLSSFAGILENSSNTGGIISSAFTLQNPVGTTYAVQTSQGALVFDSTGVIMSPNASPYSISGTVYGGGYHSLTSNGSAFFDYYYSSSTNKIECKKTTDGKTWTVLTLTGLPAASGYTSSTGAGTAPQGWNVSNTGNSPSALGNCQPFGLSGDYLAIWCGARFLIVAATSTTAMTAYLSPDGVAFTDSSNAVLGSTTLAIANNNMFVYRNGNNVLIVMSTGSTKRFSSDGGVTWSAVTGLPTSPAAGTWFQQNATTPAKLVFVDASGNAFYSSNSGSTWTSRALPTAATVSGTNVSFIAYAGSTLLYIAADSLQLYRSVDDGVTWVTVPPITGALGAVQAIFHDGYRFILPLKNCYQIVTSTDGLTYSVRDFIRKSLLASGLTNAAYRKAVALDATKTIITTGNPSTGYTNVSYTDVVYTIDGGIGWQVGRSYENSSVRYSWGYPMVISNTGFSGVVMGATETNGGSPSIQGHNIFSGADLANYGAFFTGSATAPNAIRTGTTPVLKIAPA